MGLKRRRPPEPVSSAEDELRWCVERGLPAPTHLVDALRMLIQELSETTAVPDAQRAQPADYRRRE